MCHGKCGSWAVASLLLRPWLSLHHQTGNNDLHIYILRTFLSQMEQSVILCAVSISGEVVRGGGGWGRGQEAANVTNQKERTDVLWGAKIDDGGNKKKKKLGREGELSSCECRMWLHWKKLDLWNTDPLLRGKYACYRPLKRSWCKNWK